MRGAEYIELFIRWSFRLWGNEESVWGWAHERVMGDGYDQNIWEIAWKDVQSDQQQGKFSNSASSNLVSYNAPNIGYNPRTPLTIAGKLLPTLNRILPYEIHHHLFLWKSKMWQNFMNFNCNFRHVFYLFLGKYLIVYSENDRDFVSCFRLFMWWLDRMDT